MSSARRNTLHRGRPFSVGVCAILVAGCGASAPEPCVEFFAASPDVLAETDNVTVSWRVTNTDTVSLLAPTHEGLPSEGSLVVQLTPPSTITLTASGAGGTITRSLEIRRATSKVLTSVAGTIVDLHGFPISGAAVRVGEASVTTDDQGRFSFVNVAAPYQIDFEVPGTLRIISYDGLTSTAPILSSLGEHTGSPADLTFTGSIGGIDPVGEHLVVSVLGSEVRSRDSFVGTGQGEFSVSFRSDHTATADVLAYRSTDPSGNTATHWGQVLGVPLSEDLNLGVVPLAGVPLREFVITAAPVNWTQEPIVASMSIGTVGSIAAPLGLPRRIEDGMATFTTSVPDQAEVYVGAFVENKDDATCGCPGFSAQRIRLDQTGRGLLGLPSPLVVWPRQDEVVPADFSIRLGAPDGFVCVVDLGADNRPSDKTRKFITGSRSIPVSRFGFQPGNGDSFRVQVSCLSDFATIDDAVVGGALRKRFKDVGEYKRLNTRGWLFNVE